MTLSKAFLEILHQTTISSILITVLCEENHAGNHAFSLCKTVSKTIKYKWSLNLPGANIFGGLFPVKLFCIANIL